MTDKLRVAVLGADGRMGSLVCETIDGAADLDLVARIDADDEMAELLTGRAQVVIDFTHPDVVMDHVRFAIDHGIDIVVGTSGVGQDRLDRIATWLAGQPALSVLIVPNFAIGAVLSMRFAREAARFFESVEIIELHHPGKVDAPSGTAVATAREVAAGRAAGHLGAVPDATTADAEGARGGVFDGIHLHSIRLRGLVAHQEVLFGNAGETLTIRHDSLDRSSFMPGVLLAARSVSAHPGLTVGLEALLELS